MKQLRTAAFVAVLGFAGLASGVAQAFVLGPKTPGKWGPAAVGTGATITCAGIAIDSHLEALGAKHGTKDD